MYGVGLQAVELLCENQTMRSAVDRIGEKVQTEVADSGHFRVYVEVSPGPPLFARVFTFGGSIRITVPDEEVACIKDMALRCQQ